MPHAILEGLLQKTAAAYGRGMRRKHSRRVRPPLTPGQTMEATIWVRMPVRERQAVEAAAARPGRPLSECCRRALIDANMPRT
jgi:hypothetical protein